MIKSHTETGENNLFIYWYTNERTKANKNKKQLETQTVFIE